MTKCQYSKGFLSFYCYTHPNPCTVQRPFTQFLVLVRLSFVFSYQTFDFTFGLLYLQCLVLYLTPIVTVFLDFGTHLPQIARPITVKTGLLSWVVSLKKIIIQSKSIELQACRGAYCVHSNLGEERRPDIKMMWVGAEAKLAPVAKPQAAATLEATNHSLASCSHLQCRVEDTYQ